MKLSLPTLWVHSACLLGIGSMATVSAAAQCSTTELAELGAYDAQAGDLYGTSVAIDGFLAVVGSPGDAGGTGMVYVYMFDGFNWRLQCRLTASNYQPGDRFGTSVSVSGDVVVVGAPQPSPLNANGQAYVFVKPSTGWFDMTENAILTSSTGANYDNFGYAAAIDGDTVVVGAYLDDDSGTNSGAAFVFERAAMGWRSMTETAVLTASDNNIGDQFGVSVAIDGRQVIVGADRDSDVALQAGSAYVFEAPASGWASMTESAKLTRTAPVDFDRFGLSVGSTDGAAVVGAWGDDAAAEKAGAAFVFERPVTGWANMNETATLTASNAAAGDHLGWSVDIDGDTVVAGAPANLFDGSGFGSSYVYLRPVAGWVSTTEDSTQVQSTPALDDEFGMSVSISEPLVYVGARFVETLAYSQSGASYLFGLNDDCDRNGVLDRCDVLAGNGSDNDNDGHLDNCALIGDSYCGPAVPNSTGVPSRINASGSPMVAQNNITLVASQLPPVSFGFFILSQAQGLVHQPGGSTGRLCLSGSVGRYVGPGQVQQSDAGGSFRLSLDLTQMPTPTGFVAAQPGETWNFQAWHRDGSPSGPTSNFSDGLELRLQ